MSIIDKLDKKISEKINKNKFEEDERLKEGKKFFDFWGEVYKKHLAKDFIRLEKLLKKYLEKDNRATVKINNAPHCSLEITESFSDNYNSLAICLKPRHWGTSLFNEKLFKLLDTNFYLEVYSQVSFNNEDFELKDKEKAYEHLIDLFQTDILLLKDKKNK